MTESTDELEFKFSTNDDHDYNGHELVAGTSGINGGFGKRSSTGASKRKKKLRQDCLAFTVRQPSLNVDTKHLPRHISPTDRAKSYPSELYESGGKLFCKVCNLVMDHNRVFCIKQHLITKKHMLRAAAAAIFSQTNSPDDSEANLPIGLDDHTQQSANLVLNQIPCPAITASAKRPKQMLSATTASHTRQPEVSNNELCKDWIRMCAEANIPLAKTDCPSVRNFLLKHVVNGGTIPKHSELGEKYLSEVYIDEVRVVKAKIAGQPVAVIFDEIPGLQGRCVLNILVAPLCVDDRGRLRSYLADTIFLKTVDHKTVSQAVVKTLQQYDIANENVIVFNTDNAAYMLKAFSDCLSVLYPNAIHITCLAHIVNLVEESFQKPFIALNRFIQSFSAVFFRAGARRRRFLEYLVSSNMKPLMCPDPCGTRWGGWFDALLYHCQHVHLYPSFFVHELTVTKHSQPSLEALQPSVIDYEMIAIQLNAVASKCKTVVHLTDLLVSNGPIATSVFDCLEAVAVSLEGNCRLSSDACDEFFQDRGVTVVQRQQIITELEEACGTTLGKLQKYLADGQPGIDFLKAVRVFNPTKLCLLSEDRKSFEAIIGFQEVSEEEWTLYRQQIGPAAATTTTNASNLEFFWKCAAEQLPVLATLSEKYRNAFVISADSERSNSMHKLINSPCCQRLTEYNLKILLFMYFNNKLEEIFDENEESSDSIRLLYAE